MFGVGEILGFSSPLDVDEYYKLLNCDENSSNEQINAEFKNLALESHPDKNPRNPDALVRFQKLQEAREILTDPEKRRQYDKWRRSEVSIPFKTWLALGERCQPAMHWVKPKTQIMLEGTTDHGIASLNEYQAEWGNIDREQGDTKPSIHVMKRNQWGDNKSTRGIHYKFRNYEI